MKIEFTTKDLGALLRRERLKKNLTQEQLGKIAGRSRMFISHFERGNENCSINTLKEIFNALELTLEVKKRKLDIKKPTEVGKK